MIRYLAIYNGTDRPIFRDYGLLYDILHPLMIYGFICMLTGFTLAVQHEHYDNPPAVNLLAVALVLSGLALTFISAVQCRWRWVYHFFALPMAIFVVMMSYLLAAGSRPFYAVTWPLLGFLVLGFIGARNEMSTRLQITLNTDD